MNRQQFLVLAIILASSAFVHYAFATGNVLLPSESMDKTNLPNLGLIPQDTPSPPEVQPKLPEVDPNQKSTRIPQNEEHTQLSMKPTHTKPTQPILTPQKKNYTISISLPSQTRLTPQDIDAVSEQLGIPKANVLSECRLSFNGTLLTDKGSEMVESNANMSVRVEYEGAINNALITIYAACNSAPKPASYIYVPRFEKYYGATLNNVGCQPKVPFSGTMHQIVVTHGTGNSDTCTFVP